MASPPGDAMPVWSSPFPCEPIAAGEQVDYPGPAGSIVIYDSPDRVLLRWRSEGQNPRESLDQLHRGYDSLLALSEAGSHQLLARWELPGLGDQPADPPPPADRITAALLLLWLQASPHQLDAYLQLDPGYLQRLIQAQAQPQQVLLQWLAPAQSAAQRNEPTQLQQELDASQTELDRLQQSQRQMDALMEQVKDQQRRTRRLLAVLLNKPQEGSS